MALPLEDFEAALGAQGVSEARKRDHLRILRQFNASIAPRSIQDAKGPDLADYLSQKRDEGYAPNTLRKERQMALSFFAWAYETDRIGPEALISMRATVSPQGATSRIRPQPYSVEELRKFRGEIDERWPLMDYARAEKFATRWKNGVTPYSRIRKHAIRRQLDAAIALALHCGLRRREIFALHLNDMHYDNAYIVVWSGERWNSAHREVPFTDEARAAVEAWLEFRALMGVEHEHPWLNLWAAKSAREPIKPDAFAKLLASYASAELSYRRLRHTCAISWLKAGMTLWEVQRLLGHADLKDTLPYGEALRTDLEGRVERLQEPFSHALAVSA
jgi:integrase